ncbi:MAG TPA: threonine--tRNA ligase [bacterium]|nr:threonine--tRNA ligase [bacterium]
MIELRLPDGKGLAVEDGISAGEAVKRISEGLYRKAVAVKVDGDVLDLNRPLQKGGEFRVLTLQDAKGQEVLRHSAAHVMADAVQQLFPGAKVTIGPAIEKGFYYDFDYAPGFSPEDFEKIEAKMAEIVKGDAPFVREEVSRNDAIELFEGKGENYKVELIRDLPAGEAISLYRHGGFVDLCRGPHLPSTGWIKAYKLTRVAGAYWRGDERNPMLQRIYGAAFGDKKALKDYLHWLEEAQRRDHRKLGRELDLFSIHEEVGPGFVIYHPKLGLIRTLLEEFERKEHLRRGYQIVYGPTLLKSELWQRSGHYDHYKDNMYFTEVDEVEYGIKPMNCLSHMLIYKSKVRSYRDLPLRYFELGTVHRHEKSGVLSGLFRVRAFTQDDAHILCTPEQVRDEVIGVMNFVLDVMDVFGFKVEMELSTRPQDSIGTEEAWDLATNALKGALTASGRKYEICPGEGAFYGPKIDIKLKDALDRKWQCATIQCDFTMPDRFELAYVGADGERHRPVMIHRVVLGSIERFLGVLIEHYAGAFPVWLSPVQARILPITDRHVEHGRSVLERLIDAGLRAELDDRNEKLNKKIREAEMEKVPYMLVVGDREAAEDGVSPRTRGGDDWKIMKVSDFIARTRDEIGLPATKRRR